MTSVLRAHPQIPVRVKNMMAVAPAVIPEGYTSPLELSAFTMPVGSFIQVSSVATADRITEVGYTPFDIPLAGTLFKDMGRQITVYDPVDYKHLALYRQVQLVSGAETEGVCSDASYCANIFVKVWSADGLGVVIARTG